MRSWNGRIDGMIKISHTKAIATLLAFAGPFLSLLPEPGQATTVEEDMVWTGGLRQAYFGDRPITQSDELIALEAPIRAEDAAIVPVSISAQIPQTDERHIQTIYLFIDKNPGPLIGKFHFTPKSGRADLAFRVRVNAYSPIRAIAETNDGKLYMSRRFIKATGGCSAPAGSDLDAAMARLGKIKLKTNGVSPVAEPLATQLMISHPNLSGMQMDQVTQLYAPAHFVRHVKVSFEGEEVFSAETGFGISENPSFRFYFVPESEGQLSAEVTDTNDLHFTQTLQVVPAASQDLVQN
jgi:sulfur-oxidizing protein SoxY